MTDKPARKDEVIEGEFRDAPGSALVRTSPGEGINPLALMPALDLEEAQTRYRMMVEFVRTLMTDGIDFGRITESQKPTLYKPGAEKLNRFFGLTVEFERAEGTVENWAQDDPFFNYRYGCVISKDRALVARAYGSCNSREDKYAWRWVLRHEVPPGLDPDKLAVRHDLRTEFAFAVEARETAGKYGKPADYWDEWERAIADGSAKAFDKQARSGKSFPAYQIEQTLYRIPNPEIFALVNTLDKMAQKRALIAATLIAVNASEFFTQDLEDISPGYDPPPLDGVGPGSLAPAENAAPPPGHPRTTIWPKDVIDALRDGDILPKDAAVNHVISLLNLTPFRPGDPVEWIARLCSKYRSTRIAAEQDGNELKPSESIELALPMVLEDVPEIAEFLKTVAPERPDKADAIQVALAAAGYGSEGEKGDQSDV